MITFGIFLSAVFNYAGDLHQDGKKASWMITMGLSFVFAAILGFGIIFFPETPRYDFRRGRVEQAKKTMTRIYGVSDNHWSVHTELEEIRIKLEEETQKNSPMVEWYNMFFAPKMFYRIALGMLLQMFQQLTGGMLYMP
jgi:hypothetical protein